MKASVLATILLLGFSLVRGQDTGTPASKDTCKLNVGDIQPVVGLKLGMTTSEATAGFGKRIRPYEISTTINVIKTKQNGESTRQERTTMEPIGESEFSFYPRDESNLGSIFIRFWNETIYTIVFNFDKRDFTATAGKKYSEVLAERFGLPKVGWSGSRLTCDGFYLNAIESDAGIQVEISDSRVKDVIKTKAEQIIGKQPNQLGPAPMRRDSGSDRRPVLKQRRRP